MTRVLAVDIGASSGRHIVGWRGEDGSLQTREVYRFPNGVVRRDGHLVWEIDRLEQEVRTGIDRALAAYPDVASLSVDTWGVDYVLLRGDEPVAPCYAYRDERTASAVESVHRAVPFEELYRRTGCQFQPFNSLYQLADDLARGRLDGVTDWLMIPEYLLYRLTGVKCKEYTNATTSGLVDALTGQFALDLTDRLGLARQLFPTLTPPGTVVGRYKGIPAVACATHDTASAVEGIPMTEEAPYISSGTWSLLGIKTARPLTDEDSRAANWSNEGGVGYIRYQKNIMGMWLITRLREELCPAASFDEMEAAAAVDTFDGVVDVSDPAFLAPASMRAAFDAALDTPPAGPAGYIRCAFRSLAACYARSIAELERHTGRRYEAVYIVGGGAKNTWLNDLTARASGKRIIALPIEATALGNVKIQLEAIR